MCLCLESNTEDALKWYQKAAESAYQDYQDSDFGLAINQTVALMCFKNERPEK